jgi:dihydropyrimidinase
MVFAQPVRAACVHCTGQTFWHFPRKGTIAIGSDADIVIFDANEEQTISAQTHHMRIDYSMYEGIRVKGVPKTVLSRGRVIVDNGKIVGSAGSGEFIRRQAITGLAP